MHHKADSSESSTEQEPNPSLNVDELLSLKHQTSFWALKCAYCSKSFPSSQSLGGHQNAHRSERSEERRRLYIKNPLAYRKRALMRSCKPLNVKPQVAKHELSPSLGHGPRPGEAPSRVGPMARYEFPYRAVHANWKPKLALDLNLFLVRELAGDGGYIHFKVCNEATAPDVKGLDLTLKL